MHAVQNKTTHPKGLWPLSLCYALFMWTFGYLVSALNLYFIHYIPNSASQADNYTYTFLALLWILPIAGGYMAQRCGYFTAAISGLCFCIVGTIGLTFSGQINLTLFGLSCFLTGNALFTPSLWCLVDHLYHKDDPRRESGFTLFYLLFNLGCVAGIFTENQINATAGYAAAFAVCNALLLGTLLLLQHFKKIIKQTSSRCPAPQLAQNQSKLYYTLFSSCGFSSVLVSLLFFYSFTIFVILT